MNILSTSFFHTFLLLIFITVFKTYSQLYKANDLTKTSKMIKIAEGLILLSNILYLIETMLYSPSDLKFSPAAMN